MRDPLRQTRREPRLATWLPATEYVASLATAHSNSQRNRDARPGHTPLHRDVHRIDTRGGLGGELGSPSDAAVDRSQPDCERGKNTGGGHLRGRPSLAGRAIARTDDADAVFFRAADRDRRVTRQTQLALDSELSAVTDATPGGTARRVSTRNRCRLSGT